MAVEATIPSHGHWVIEAQVIRADGIPRPGDERRVIGTIDLPPPSDDTSAPPPSN